MNRHQEAAAKARRHRRDTLRAARAVPPAPPPDVDLWLRLAADRGPAAAASVLGYRIVARDE